MSSQRDTQITTFWSSSTARQAIAPSKASASTEHQLPPSPTMLARAGPCGEMVSRVQAKFVQQGVRERGPNNTRWAERALSETLRPYWETPSLLKRLTGYSWWVKAVEEVL